MDPFADLGTFFHAVTFSLASYIRVRSKLNDFYAVKWMRELFRFLHDKLEFVLEAKVSVKRRLHLSFHDCFICLDFLRNIVSDFWIARWKFGCHRFMRDMLGSASDDLDLNTEHICMSESKHVLYCMWSPLSRHKYFGISIKPLATRVWTPVICLHPESTCSCDLKVLEWDWIRWTRASMDMPYVKSVSDGLDGWHGGPHVVSGDCRRIRSGGFGFRHCRSRADLALPTKNNFKFNHTKCGSFNAAGTKSLAILAIRMGETRRKGQKESAVIRWLQDHRPSAIKSLVRRLSTCLTSHSRSIALRRLMDVAGYQATRSSVVRLRLPWLPRTSLEDLAGDFLSALRTGLSRGQAVLLQIRWGRAPQTIRFLCNINRWNKQVDVMNYPCSCHWMESYLGVSRSRFGHCVALASRSKFGEQFPSCTNFKSPLVPSFAMFYDQVAMQFWRIAHDCKLSCDFRSLHPHNFDVFTTKTYGFNGIRADLLRPWKSMLDEHVVVSPVDKFPAEVGFVCPQYWQATLMQNQLILANLCVEIPPEIQDHSTDMRNDYKYTGACARSSHEFGQISWWPNRNGWSDDLSEFTREKFRPTGSYFSHMLRDLFSLVCRAGLFMIGVLCPANSSICAAGKVMGKYRSMNLTVASRISSGYASHVFPKKFDADSFFNEVPYSLIRSSWDWLLERWLAVKGSLRMYLAMPRKPACRRVSHPTAFRRGFGGRIRQVAMESSQLIPRIQANKNVCDKSLVIGVRHMWRMIASDFRYGFSRLGTTLVKSNGRGITQGSPLSMFLADVCLVCVECRNYDSFILMSSQWLSLVCRWVDDIMIQIIYFYPVDYPVKRDDVSVGASTLINVMLGHYESTNLKMKREDPATFAGIDIPWHESRQQFELEQHIPCDKLLARRFQNVFSFVPRKALISTVASQMCSAIGRYEGMDLPSSIAKVLECFLVAGLAISEFSVSSKQVCRKHAYLHRFLHTAISKLGS